MTRYNISFGWSLKEHLFFQDDEENVVNSEFLHIHESKSLFRDQDFEFLHTSPLTSAAFKFLGVYYISDTLFFLFPESSENSILLLFLNDYVKKNLAERGTAFSMNALHSFHGLLL